MENQLNINFETENTTLELLAEKQDYLDYIDADMEAFYAIKAEAINPTA